MGLVLGIAPAGGQHLLGGADPVGPLGLGQVLLGLADPPFLLHFLLGDLCLAAGLAHPLALGQGHLDGRQQGALGHRLDQIARDPGLAGPADEGLVVEGGEQHHAAGQILLQDGLGGGQPVENRHLHIHQHYVRPLGPAELHRVEPVPGLAHHLEIQLGEHIGQIHPGNGLIVRNDYRSRPVTLPFPGKIFRFYNNIAAMISQSFPPGRPGC